MDAEACKRDAELVSQFRSGKESSFDELVRRHMEKSVQLARAVCGNYEDAKDISQEAFVKAYHALKNFKGDAQFSTWFYRILMNTAKDHWRKKKWARFVEWKQNEAKDNFLESLPSADPTPGGSALGAEFEGRVSVAIQKLPFQQQWVFLLRFTEDYSLAEIAAATGLAEGTVKATLHFAMKKFKAAVAPHLEKGGKSHGRP